MTRNARLTDPSTSYAAVPVNITAQAFKILQQYARAARHGLELIDHDAYMLAGFHPNARDGQRCSDLRRLGLIERIKDRGRTPSGKLGHYCRITDKGLRFLTNAEGYQ